ncbi:uncharacterized protein LOC133866265 [Alnus glutinosa]|uniref:uncharacterized protein LOC133866265 n=1 Tax=Alnus glutinosa TaxID=3517 RepID=UPI002D77B444|nr:uncharacterized protein LOC133866265 [Alnus glutinosa]
MICKLAVAAAYQVDRLTECVAGGLVPAAWCDLVKTEECSVFTFNARQINKSSETVKVVQHLMQKQQGLAFCGHDESKNSSNQGNFRELLQFLAKHNEEIDKVVLENAPENHQMTAPDIQKEIANAAASETLDAILKDLGDSSFAILVDEARDISVKEQLAIVLRYVDKKGHVIERFLGITHVSNTTAATLKMTIESVLIKHHLSISKLRGQGYDGASNMRGKLNGLKTLILNENSSAYYVHCFAHQLQLTLVVVAKNHIQIATFFSLVNSVFNVVGASCKRRDTLREKRIAEVVEALQNNEISTGRGLNQEMNLKRPGDTRWSSHYGAIINLIIMFSSIIEAVEDIVEDDDLFAAFNKDNILCLAQLYPNDFSAIQLMTLDNQLETYIIDMRSSEEFATLKGIGQLAEKMVEMKKYITYPLVYSLVTLSLILSVAIATVERAFSAMNIVKNRLRNRMGDQWMNDYLVTYIEKDIFKTINNEKIMQRFQGMKTRRGQLN